MTTNATTSFEQRLDAYLASFQPTPEVLAARQKADEEREEFLRRFPLDSIPNLTLEQYCIGKGDRENFCWWVERGTKLYNSYFPGSSAAYGLWYSAKPGKNQKWYGNDGPGYGKTSQIQAYLKEHADATEADALREVILKPLHAFLVSRGRDKTPAIRHLMIGNGFILKLLNLYFPEDYIVINSGKWITKILSAIREDASIDVFDGNRRIHQFFNRKKEQFAENDFSQYDFVAFLEKELKLKEKEPPKDEDQKAKTEPAMNQQCSLNTILYGPPGTGKTFNAINYAVAIIEGRAIEEVQAEDYDEVRKRYSDYKEQGRIAFTTFHQSYGYEDFIEGIRPVLVGEASANSKDDSEQGEAETNGEVDEKAEKRQTGDVKYTIHDGIFKSFCNFDIVESPFVPLPVDEEPPISQEEFRTAAFNVLNRANDVVWKVSLGGSLRESRGKRELENIKQIHFDCFSEGNMRIGWDEYGSNPEKDFDYAKGIGDCTGGKSEIESFIHTAQIGDIVISLCSDTEIDGIGVITGNYEWTGKSQLFDEPEYGCFNRVRKVLWAVSNVRINILDVNGGKRLAQSTFYKTNISKQAILALVQTEFAKTGSDTDERVLDDGNSEATFTDDSDQSSPRVFIIDEINRGNISKIFGELITLIEPNKRLGADEETKATLPYSGKEFGVPKNVYILGTMNTADRSIALLDTALRRRFDFVEMMPEPGRLADIEVEETGIDLEEMLQTMNDRIEFLLDREHTIGHAYFMGDFKKNPTLDALADIFRNKILPLLQEYFFDDYSKICLVLGDNAKPRDDQFVQEETNHASLFAGTPIDIDLDKPTYRINPGAFERVEAYTGIYA